MSWSIAALTAKGIAIAADAQTFADHYSQARLFFRSQTDIEQAHIANALVFELSKVVLPDMVCLPFLIQRLMNSTTVDLWYDRVKTWPERQAAGADPEPRSDRRQDDRQDERDPARPS